MAEHNLNPQLKLIALNANRPLAEKNCRSDRGQLSQSVGKTV